MGSQSPELLALFLVVPSLGMSRHVPWKSKLGGLGAERSGLHALSRHRTEVASWADAVAVQCCPACQQPARYSHDNRLHCARAQKPATGTIATWRRSWEKMRKLESQTLAFRLMCVPNLYLILHFVNVILHI